ncbi:hypothetical protein C0971_08785 [Bacillus methanolicus]|uniref:DUF1657 domain-containing protein n=1 Tax=Bacillus methanolicus TaxID=1471 RepID=UPI00200FBE87|nr:DUF1657 domain-containing protein [Bacillus methanolicus]UQD52097.1 hypothetical protein C0971_08785 [Bacillus methanolicus]
MTIASNVNQLLATIKGIETQLSNFALNSQDENAQRIFHECMLVMQEVKNDLEIRKNEIEFEEPQYKNS